MNVRLKEASDGIVFLSEKNFNSMNVRLKGFGYPRKCRPLGISIQ